MKKKELLKELFEAKEEACKRALEMNEDNTTTIYLNDNGTTKFILIHDINDYKNDGQTYTLLNFSITNHIIKEFKNRNVRHSRILLIDELPEHYLIQYVFYIIGKDDVVCSNYYLLEKK